MELATNVVIAGRFRLNKLIGRGGMGSVWHATHLGLDIPCAVKFIEGEYALLPEAQARFEREAKAAAQMRSPHVVQILDHGLSDGTPYIAMELLDGEDLGKRMARVGRLPTKELLTIVNQVARALSKAHGFGIVHRDLKPDNIFLVHDDDREIAKVLDFGIAKANTKTLDGSNTKTGAMLGTPYYMSPEQAQGTKSVDYRSDLWSLAVIAYQAVTGQLPFESEALGDLLVKIIVSPIPVPSQAAPDVPASFDRWWARAAAREPSQRFQSAKELSDSLGLVFGFSSITDMHDRSALRREMQSSTGAVAMPAQGEGSGANPFPRAPLTPAPDGRVPTLQTPGFERQPSAPNFQTPANAVSGGMPHVLTPQPTTAQATPNAVLNSTTGSPLSRSFSTPAGVPKKTNWVIFGVAGLGAVTLLVLGIVVMITMRKAPVADGNAGHSNPAAAAAAPADSTPSTASIVIPPEPPAANPPSAPAAANPAAPEPKAEPKNAAATPPSTPRGQPKAAAATPPAVKAPTAVVATPVKPPPTPPKKKEAELGF